MATERIDILLAELRSWNEKLGSYVVEDAGIINNGRHFHFAGLKIEFLTPEASKPDNKPDSIIRVSVPKTTESSDKSIPNLELSFLMRDGKINTVGTRDYYFERGDSYDVTLLDKLEFFQIAVRGDESKPPTLKLDMSLAGITREGKMPLR